MRLLYVNEGFGLNKQQPPAGRKHFPTGIDLFIVEFCRLPEEIEDVYGHLIN